MSGNACAGRQHYRYIPASSHLRTPLLSGSHGLRPRASEQRSLEFRPATRAMRSARSWVLGAMLRHLSLGGLNDGRLLRATVPSARQARHQRGLPVDMLGSVFHGEVLGALFEVGVMKPVVGLGETVCRSAPIHACLPLYILV